MVNDVYLVFRKVNYVDIGFNDLGSFMRVILNFLKLICYILFVLEY